MVEKEERGVPKCACLFIVLSFLICDGCETAGPVDLKSRASAQKRLHFKSNYRRFCLGEGGALFWELFWSVVPLDSALVFCLRDALPHHCVGRLFVPVTNQPLSKALY